MRTSGASAWAVVAMLGSVTIGGLLAGCTASDEAGPRGPAGDDQNGGVALGTVRLLIRLPESLALSRLLPDATRLVRVTVSASDLVDDAVGEVALSAGHGSTYTMDLHVPSGANRTVLVEAFDAAERLLAAKSTVVNIAAAAVTSVSITLTPEGWVYPAVTASATPSSVQIAQSVSFSGVGTDLDGSIAKYEWDFNGDGTWDYSSATTASTTHSYGTSGSYGPLLRVTDNDNLTATSDPLTITVGGRLAVSPLTVDYGEAGTRMALIIDDTAVSPATGMAWTISESIWWLTPSATSGTVTGGGQRTVTLTITRVGLTAGTYEKTLTVNAGSAGSATVTIRVVQSILHIVVD